MHFYVKKTNMFLLFHLSNKWKKSYTYEKKSTVYHLPNATAVIRLSPLFVVCICFSLFLSLYLSLSLSISLDVVPVNVSSVE